MQVCLIRKRYSSAWGIPKGTVDSGDTHASTALKEAWEEAGVRGRLVGDPLGTYKYQKLGRPLQVLVHMMEVLEQYDEWEEAIIRERKWATFDEADALLSEHPAHQFLSLARRLFPVDA